MCKSGPRVTPISTCLMLQGDICVLVCLLGGACCYLTPELDTSCTEKVLHMKATSRPKPVLTALVSATSVSRQATGHIL
jgi:hypothetical protein